VYLQQSTLTLEDLESMYGVTVVDVFSYKQKIIERTFAIDDEKLFWVLEMKQPFCVYPS